MTSNFCPQCGNKLEIGVVYCSKCGAQIDPASATRSEKSAVTTLLLCLFLGAFGIHRFYVGKIGTGILMLITFGGFGLWTLVDLIMIATCNFKDKKEHPLIFVQGKSSGIKLALKVVGSIFAAILVYIFLLITLVMYATSGMTDTVFDQLNAIKSGDMNKAYYSYTSKAFQKETSLQDFKQFINHYESLKNNKDARFKERNMMDGQGVLKGTLESDDGVIIPIEYYLIKEDNVWKIIQIQIPSPAAGIEVDKPDNNNSQSASNSGAQVYTDNNLNFTIKYPGNWETEKTKPNSVLFGGKKGTPSYYATVIVQVIAAKKSGGAYENATEATADLKKLIQEQAPDVKIDNETQVELPLNAKDFKGEAFVATYTYQGVKMKKLQFIVSKKGAEYIYAFGYTAPEKQFNKDLPVAKAMYESWDIK
jgi:TM2 domain-containing membrane protein YozV